MRWDANDPDPPACKPATPPKTRELPDELPAFLAARMHAKFAGERNSGACPVGAMRAAYKALKQYLRE